MPQRFLKPGITNSPRWNSVSWRAQSLYVRLLTQVDDFGRCDGRASVIWGACFAVWNELHPNEPVSLPDVQAMLSELVLAGLAKWYGTEGKTVLQIEQWTERLREGVKERWPAMICGKLQQVAATRSKPEVAASCSKLLPSPSPSPSPSSSPPVAVAHGANASRPASKNSEQIIEGLKANPAYAGIDVAREFGKMAAWCQAHGKQPTERRFVNWLNRCERPLTQTPTTKPDHSKAWK